MSKSANQSATLVGRRAPDFELQCTHTAVRPGRVVRLDDFRDRWLVLMFYPQDFSLVCPTELLALSDRYEEFVERGADVLAISTDSIESHEQWLAKPRAEGGLGALQYPLGSDSTGDISRAYRVYVDGRHIALRGLFIIDPNSVVQMQVIHNLSVGRRSEDVLRVLNALQVGGLCAENWTSKDETIDAAKELRPGSIISHYQIEERIGDGGFAAVFRAYDRTLQRRVALKILKSLNRRAPGIEQEARAAAALNHPNVCTVYNIDDSEGIAMIVMEYLDGQSLSQVIAHGPAPPETVARVAVQIARGMAAAHEAGIVHGDLKPANIILTRDDTVKVLDFGLAGRHQIRDLGDGTLSVDWLESGAIAGTPSYMSPEQADGARATAESDVFAFGLIIHEMLTGRQVFAASQILKVLSAVRAVNSQKLAASLSEPFSSLVGRMLVRDRAHRTITMSDAADALENAAEPSR